MVTLCRLVSCSGSSKVCNAFIFMDCLSLNMKALIFFEALGCTYVTTCCNIPDARLRWSRGSVLAFGTQVRGFKPGRSRRVFQGEKILSTPSFGKEVKPSVPCRRFKACKRFLNVTWKSGISGKIHRPFLAHIVPPLATRISGETTSGESWNV